MKQDNQEIRLRFAPSPTGFLHIGNLRTALFGYLIAKSQGGKFILRIEDTDEKREVEGAVKSLLEILTWAGIEFDEGPGIGGELAPYIQSQRFDIYQKYSDELLAQGKAYRCFCSSELLEKMRNDQAEAKLPPRYNRACRDLSPEESLKRVEAGEKFVIRQKIPLAGEVKVIDELRGEIIFQAHDLDDQVLIKSNGVPTYQFANVIDDHLMKISHVTRGDEWLSSFPKNILLYEAFNWQAPKFIHLPLLLNKGGGKLSKRQGDVFVEDYRAKGYIKEAIINFCALLGWHPQGDKEILSIEELKNDFSISGLGSSPAIFDLEKLDFFNAYYLRQKSEKELIDLARPYLIEANLPTEGEKLERAFLIARDRLKKLSDSPEALSFFFEKIEAEENLIVWKNNTLETAKNNLAEILDFIAKIEENFWTKENLEEEVLGWVKREKEGRNGDYLWPLRTALSGLKNSPSPFEIAWVIGKEESIKRIKEVLNLQKF
ncbi:glutamate--tRNA ligase [Candidatus Falkowbacteria bacterium]|nr:glutamate--tRNA ligase [Candidatus Falkowbacteria bacterium]NCT55030.1 glutamate--tRNA ligase [Candidatus Falkowbacteria bacterium]